MEAIVVITLEEYFENEVESIIALANRGGRIHLRKPRSSSVEFGKFCEKIAPFCPPKSLCVHYFEDVAQQFGLDFHSSFKPFSEMKKKAEYSLSCHSFSEAYQAEGWGVPYYFLSPIFASISKSGYTPKFSLEEVNNFLKTRTKGSKCVALGGITDKNIEKVVNFDSIALLGWLWVKKNDNSIDLEKTIYKFKNINYQWQQLKDYNI